MKPFRIVLVALVLLLNLVIAQPSWADRPNLTATPDYTEVTQGINNLLQAKESRDPAGLPPEQVEQQLGELKLQKYILETAKDWAQCTNETGKTLAVYAHKAKKGSAQPGTLFYLGNGQTTDDDWNCDAVYLPTGAKVAGLPNITDVTEPLAVKIVGGTQLIAKTNPAGEIQFNINPAKIFKAGEGNLSVPDISQANIDASIPNAPIED